MNKTAEQYTEDLLGAIDIMSKSVLKEIKTNTSLLCDIVDASKSAEGKYIVKPVQGVGVASFTAVSENTNYKKDEQVYVTIPNSDFNEEKIITGKKDSKNGISYTYVSPEQTVIKIGSNILANMQYQTDEQDYQGNIVSLIANVNTAADDPTLVPQSQSIVLTPKYPVTIEPGTADKILVKIKEKTDFPTNGVKSGNFGVRINLQSMFDPSQNYIIDFDTTDMVGNIYNFSDYLEQVLLGDLKDLPQDNKIDAWKNFQITSLEFFQSGDFINWYGNIYQPIEENEDPFGEKIGSIYKEDIFFSLPDIEVYLAADIKGLTEDKLEVTPVRTEYHQNIVGAQEDIIETTFSWIHKENGSETKIITDLSGYIVEVYHFVQSSNSENAYLGKGWMPLYNTAPISGKSYLKFNEKFYELNTINSSEKIRILINSGSASDNKKFICMSNEIDLINANPIEVSSFERYQDVDIIFDDAGLNGNYFVYSLDNNLKQIYQIPKVAKFVYSDKVTQEKKNNLYPFWRVNKTFLYNAQPDLTNSMIESATENADKSLTFTIKTTYNQNWTNNIIACEFFYPGDVVTDSAGTRPINGAQPAYVAERLLNFGWTALYNGTGYFITYEIESAAAGSTDFNPVQYPALDGKNRNVLRIIPTLHTPDGSVEEGVDWTWNWMYGDLQSEAAQSIEVFYEEKAPSIDEETGEEEEDTRTGKVVPWLGKLTVKTSENKIIEDYFSVAKAHENYQANTISNKIIYDSSSGYPFEDTKSWKLGLSPAEPSSTTWSVEWNQIDNIEENGVSSKYMTPTIVNGYLIPASIGGDVNLLGSYFKLIATATIDDYSEAIWEEYLIIRKNLWPSSIFNNWNGELKVDEGNGVIYSPRYVAGRKDGDKFTGVAIGDFSKTDSEGSLTEATGIFGFNQGNQVYALKDDGTMFIQSPNGSNRIDLGANDLGTDDQVQIKLNKRMSESETIQVPIFVITPGGGLEIQIIPITIDNSSETLINDNSIECKSGLNFYKILLNDQGLSVDRTFFLQVNGKSIEQKLNGSKINPDKIETSALDLVGDETRYFLDTNSINDSLILYKKRSEII